MTETLPFEGLPVAVDAMGGDLGPVVQVEGAVKAFKEYGIESILVGPEDTLSDILASLGASSLPLGIRHAKEVIEMGESPTRAVRKKPNSSLCVACELGKKNEVSAVLSSGSSGALMAAGGIICGRITGIERPAIATLLPRIAENPQNIILDVGANVDSHAHNLSQFAVMGAIYYSTLFDINFPRVGLLSNGEEPSKGTDQTRAAALTLSRVSSVNYIGYVEGRDIGGDKAHVIVCDGFVGNVVLKSMEGIVNRAVEQLRFEAKKSFLKGLSLRFAKPHLKNVFEQQFSYATFGGAPLLGLKKLVLVLHGSSNQSAVTNAIKSANYFAQADLTAKVNEGITRLEEDAVDIEDELIGQALATSSRPEKKNGVHTDSSLPRKIEEEPKDRN